MRMAARRTRRGPPAVIKYQVTCRARVVALCWRAHLGARKCSPSRRTSMDALTDTEVPRAPPGRWFLVPLPWGRLLWAEVSYVYGSVR